MFTSLIIRKEFSLRIIKVIIFLLLKKEVNFCSGDQSAFLTGHNPRLVLCNNDVWTLGELTVILSLASTESFVRASCQGFGVVRTSSLRFLLGTAVPLDWDKVVTGLAFLLWGEERRKVGPGDNFIFLKLASH